MRNIHLCSITLHHHRASDIWFVLLNKSIFDRMQFSLQQPLLPNESRNYWEMNIEGHLEVKRTHGHTCILHQIPSAAKGHLLCIGMRERDLHKI